MRKADLRAETPEQIKEAQRIRGIISFARKCKELDQRRMAEKLGICSTYYNKIENDFKSANTYMQDKICEMLDLPKPKIFEKGL